MNSNKVRDYSLLKNSILNTLYQVLSVLLPLFTAPYVSRVLMADGIGISSYVHSLASYFTLGSALGTIAYGTMIIAKQRKTKALYSKTFWEIELITVFSSLTCLFVWILLSSLYLEYRLYLLIMSFNILAVMFDISWLYSGLEKFHYTIAINFIFKILSIACIFVFVKTPSDLPIYLMISSVSILLGNISMWIFLPKTIEKARVDFRHLGNHLKQTLVFFAPAIATSVYTILDKTLIGVLIPGTTTILDSNGLEVTKKISELENGYYEQATKLINIIKSVSFIGIVGVMTSRASFLYEENDIPQVKSLLNTTFNITSFLTIGSGFGIAAIAITLIPAFFGDGYAPVVEIVYILAAIPFIISISNVLGGMYYTPSGRRKQSSLYLIVGACVNLVLNIPFIILLKAKGAAIASIIAELSITLFYLFNCKKMLTIREIIKFTWKKILSGIIMFVLLFCFTHFIGGAINRYILIGIQLFGGILVYCLSLFALRDRSLYELFSFLKKAFAKKARQTE